MKTEKIYTQDVPPNPPTISHAVKAGGIVTISGQVGKRADGTYGETPEEQIRIAMENLKKIVEASGADMGSVMFCQCYLKRQEDFKIMNEIYHPYFEGVEVPPARCTVLCDLVNPRLYFEISAVAAIKED